MNNRYLLLVICLSFSFLKSNAFTVQGLALLSSATDHSGVAVNFIPKSPSAVAVSGMTLLDGGFSISVVAGLYDIKYSKNGYQNLLFVDQLISTDLILNQVILSSKPMVHVSGDVQGTWSNANTYMIDGDISIPPGNELIIQAGTVIQFPGFYQMIVNGKLTAIGTKEEKIIFTSNKTNKARGDWAGIFVNTFSDTTIFDFCQIEYGASKNLETSIINNTGNTKITNSLIRGSAYAGISNRYGGFLKIESSEITDVYFYGIVSTSSAKGGTILNSKIHDVDLIGLSCQWTISLVKGNQVYNTGYNAISSYGNMRIENNLLYNNPYGVFVVSDKPTIRNNTIFNNNQGIGFYNDDFWKPSAIITGNILYHNSNYGIYCEGIYGPEKVEYNLISENPSGIANRGPIGLGIKVTTNIYGHQADTYLNIFDAPSFFSVDSQNENFLYLLPASAAIDAGDPQFKDPDNSTSDCGAIPFQKYNQTILFDNILTKTVGDPDFKINAQSTSGLPIEFSSSNASKVLVNNNIVQIFGAGEATIIAKQSGTISFKAVETFRKFCINPAKPTITTSDLNTDSPKLASSNSVGNQWYLNGTAITGATSSSFVAKESGSYTVKTTVDICSSELSAEQILVVTGDLKTTLNSDLRVFPNPSNIEISIQLDGFIKLQPVDLEIYETSGKQVEVINALGGEVLQVNIRTYPTGSYVIKASQKGKSVVKRFIKQ